jgi:phosphoribosylformylglycinamidine synthase
VLLLGTTRDELGGSEWAHHVHGHLGGRPPQVDLAAERALAELLVEAAARGLVRAAHDLSDGGLAQGLSEMVLRHGVGVTVALVEVTDDAFTALFSESAARVVVAVASQQLDDFGAAATAAGVPVTALGRTGGDALVVDGLFRVGVGELRTAHEATLPALFG